MESQGAVGKPLLASQWKQSRPSLIGPDNLNILHSPDFWENEDGVKRHKRSAIITKKKKKKRINEKRRHDLFWYQTLMLYFFPFFQRLSPDTKKLSAIAPRCLKKKSAWSNNFPRNFFNTNNYAQLTGNSIHQIYYWKRCLPYIMLSNIKSIDVDQVSST